MVPARDAAERCAQLVEVHEKGTAAAVAALERRVTREVGAIPSASEVKEVMDERCGHVDATLQHCERRVAAAAAVAKGLNNETEHLQRTLGRRLHALEMAAAASTKHAMEAKAQAADFAQG